jgi:hypothetical protein
MSIRMYLDASTKHLPLSELIMLTEGVDYLFMVKDTSECVFWIYASPPLDMYGEDLEDMKVKLPNLLRLVIFAVEHHCAWMKLDEAGDIIDKMPVYDW